MSSLKKSGLKLSDLKQFKLLHLTRDLLSALGGYPIRAGLSGLSLDAPREGSSLRLGCSVDAWFGDLMLSNLRWNVWSGPMQSELGCLV